MKLKVENKDINIRLDNYVSKYLNESRSFINKHIKLGNILVNKNKVKSGYLLKENDEVEINDLKEDISIKPQNIKLDIYYEDDYIMVVNKPSGMTVHPAPGNYTNTLVNALLYHTNKLSDINGENRPGIVHRIDKDTSGLLVISKTNEVHRKLSLMFKNKTIKRKYVALVKGVINENKGRIEAPIGRSVNDRKKMDVKNENSKKAITNFKVLERYKNATLLELELETGRTHQIRVHLAYIKHPIINDIVYNKDKEINNYGQMLHAAYLGFNHPITNEFVEFNAPLEKEFLNILNIFKNS